MSVLSTKTFHIFRISLVVVVKCIRNGNNVGKYAMTPPRRTITNHELLSRLVQRRSQPDNLVQLCKFQIIVNIHFFRNWLFAHSTNRKVFG